MLLPEGTYTVLANAFGYETAAVPGVVIVQDETTTVDFTLEALPRFTVSGEVTSAENGRPLANVEVRAVGTPVEPAGPTGRATTRWSCRWGRTPSKPARAVVWRWGPPRSR